MTQANIDSNGDLHITFSEKTDDVTTTYKLDNGAELDFIDEELVELILPNFEEQLGRGSLLGLEITVNNVSLDDMTILFSLDIQGHTINGRVDCSSLE